MVHNMASGNKVRSNGNAEWAQTEPNWESWATFCEGKNFPRARTVAHLIATWKSQLCEGWCITWHQGTKCEATATQIGHRQSQTGTLGQHFVRQRTFQEREQLHT